MPDKSTPWGTPSLCMAAVKHQLLQLLGTGDAAVIQQALVTGDGTAYLLMANHMEKNQILSESSSCQGKVGVQSKPGTLSFSGPAQCAPNPRFHRPGGSLGRQYKMPLAEEEAKTLLLQDTSVWQFDYP